MKLFASPTIDAKNQINRMNYFSKLDISDTSIITPKLIHSNNIQTATINDGGSIIYEIDGLLTSEKGLFLTVTVADCLPVYLYDDVQKVVGLIHAGWRGLSKDIIINAVVKMEKAYNTNPASIMAGIGPAICKNHYEVKDDVMSAFQDYPQSVIETGDKKFLDLQKIAYLQLIKAGLAEKNVEINSECTYELQKKYFSYRRDKPSVVETMVAVIGMRE